MTTPLATARADAVICRAAVRALRRGERAREVVKFLATYAGLPLAPAWGQPSVVRVTITGDSSGAMAALARAEVAVERHYRKRRWWSR